MKLSYLQFNEVEARSSGEFNELRKQFLASSQKKAVIIGAGPSGLAAGIVLRARGWDVIILEQRKSFTRDTVVGINKAALGWFEQHNILEAILAHSSKTAFYPTQQNFPKNEDLLDAELWLNKEANTTNTILTKFLQKILYEKYIATGGLFLSDISVQLHTDQVCANDWKIHFDDVDLIIGAFGANLSQNKVKNYPGIPTQHFANVIIDKKPENLRTGIYFHLDKKNYSAAISASDVDFSLNFQTDLISGESASDTAQRLKDEAKTHLQDFLKTKSLQLAHDCAYYPINAGKISTDIRLNKMIVATPSRFAIQMVYADKFIIIGDAKGVSSPRAGLGASLGVAYDATVIDLFAQNYEVTNDKPALFALTENRLKQSIDIWAQKTMEKLGIKPAEQHNNQNRFWQQKPTEKQTHQNNTPSCEGML